LTRWRISCSRHQRCRNVAARSGFYAGVAITYSVAGGDAQKVGTLCVYGAEPRASFGEDERRALLVFGERVSSVLSSPLGPLSHRTNSDGNERHLDSVSERVQALMKCAAFKMRPVDPGQMLKIAEKTTPVFCEAGDQVARLGDKCDVVWFVASGSLRCEVDGIECQILEAGQSIGEMSFVAVSTMVSAGTDLEEARETSTRSADVIACEHTELLELSFDDAWRVVKTVPNLFYTLKEVADLKVRHSQRCKSMAMANLAK